VLDATSSIAPSVLVVEPSLDELLVVMSRLATAGFRVTVAESFAQARPFLAAQPPALLITALRLGAYNGLHLVLRGKAIDPRMKAIVTTNVADMVLQADAETMGATFVVTPIGEREMLGAVLQTVFRPDGAPPIRPPFERRARERRAALTLVASDRRVSDRRRSLPWLVPARSE
jgi:DNA-binding NtrC family response regulator